MSKNRWIIVSLFVVALISILIFLFNKNSNSEILSINGKSIGIQEFEIFLNDNKAVVLSDFYNNYGIQNYNENFWTTPIFDNQTIIPINVLIDKAIKNITRTKVEQQEAEKYGIVDNVTFDELLKIRDTVNKQRAIAKKRGEVIYGPLEYDIKQYYSYYYGNISLPLLTELRKEVFSPTEEQLRANYDKTKASQYETPVSGELDFYMINDEKSELDESKISEIFDFVRKEIENKTESNSIIIMLKNKFGENLFYKTNHVDKLEVGKEDNNYQNIIDILYELNIGDISEVIYSNSYIGIFKVKEKSEIRIKSFEEVKEIVTDNYMAVMYEEYISKLAEEAEIKTNPNIEKKALYFILGK